MLFNSAEFLLFFPVVFALYFALPSRWRWLLLLVASYVFYAFWNPAYLLLIWLSTVVDYVAARRMGDSDSQTDRRRYLFLSLAVNLGLLFTFKYFNFFRDTLVSVGFEFIPALDLLLPVGISFYTFQTLSYTIDVYRGAIGPERHFGRFALYVAFFPQLVAGPIERSTRLLPQLRRSTRFDYDRIVRGMRQMLWGFFKKVVIADRLAESVNLIYNNATDYSGAPLIAATVFFALQIYCDFSGYSDIAIGAAKILGFDLMENFRQPYFSRSIREFWQRWHISLSSWFRDYVYIPLGGSRVAVPRIYLNLLITFLVSGLWHGAAWTFVLWGGLHGGYIVVERATQTVRDQIWQVTRLERIPLLRSAVQLTTTLSLVVFAWILFRANSFADARHIITHLLDGLSISSLLSSADGSIRHEVLGGYPLLTMLAAIAALLLGDLLAAWGNISERFNQQPTWLRWTVYHVAIFAILIFGQFNQQEFIYFQF